MKYLNSYKLFESTTDMEIAELAKQEIEDILIFLKDNGCHVKVQAMMDEHSIVFVNILNYDNNPIMWSDIKDDIDRAIECVNDRFIPATAYYKVIQPDGRVFNKNNRDVDPWSRFYEYMNYNNRKLAYLSFELVQIVNH